MSSNEQGRAVPGRHPLASRAAVRHEPERRSWRAQVAAVAIRTASRVVNVVRLARLPSHRLNVGRSRRVLRAVRRFWDPLAFPQCMSYLRKVEPLVFEEVVLSALEDAGLLVLRNRRYSGDGGIDGVVWLPGRGWYAIQVKRYQSYVDREHVRAFGAAVRMGGFSGGLFVHTGRSGAAVYEELVAGGIHLVSGQRLAELITCRMLPVWR